MTNPHAIVERIEQARLAAHRSVAWLSEATGIADKTLRRRLNAPDQFTLAELNAIATALGVTLEYLFAPAAAAKVAA
ncbi:helix-turn-helix transcriptional regulator [Microbacterium sp. 5K110]|jgi:transcriptional regulator with XRE-family HTH domain|uniref:helix-turn-helix domain-containing protein n=1 Tax=unclassified Microbacterium TaxID=2609290 RepID=UPI0010FDA428|nr:helix-turn-helix transcriptional regulator [Microbacterium sp. 5K110]TLF33932.1 helix-turn-helix transcriptional regulator [Microbacterium sp. 5K110]